MVNEKFDYTRFLNPDFQSDLSDRSWLSPKQFSSFRISIDGINQAKEVVVELDRYVDEKFKIGIRFEVSDLVRLKKVTDYLLEKKLKKTTEKVSTSVRLYSAKGLMVKKVLLETVIQITDSVFVENFEMHIEVERIWFSGNMFTQNDVNENESRIDFKTESVGIYNIISEKAKKYADENRRGVNGFFRPVKIKPENQKPFNSLSIEDCDEYVCFLK